TSQALGRRDLPEVVRLLVRSLTVALLISLAILLLQVPIAWLAFSLMSPTAEILPFALRYFYICIWGAPAMLGLYGLTGWYIGMQNTRLPMFISIMQNVVNIAMSCLLVYCFGMKVEGVAIGTVVAQWAGFLVGLFLLKRNYWRMAKYFQRPGIFLRSAMVRFFSVNRDIFLRTLCLVAVNMYFTSAGAQQGAVILAVNTLLMQLFLLFSYVMDGFAYAGEAMAGKYYGAGNMVALRDTVWRVFRWGGMMALLFTIVYIQGGSDFLSLLTDEQSVVAASAEYLPWAVLIPFAGLAAFVWDGIFIGLTATRSMLMSLVFSALAFFAICFTLVPFFGNHALWLALVVYVIVRGLVLTVAAHKKIKKA
ncbi:MAG: MATE family efflux transporter, partial [Prevotella sp.]|nr:MATE family efflux transporter [Prevotella sp.]